MNKAEAKSLLQTLLGDLSYDMFFERIVGQGPHPVASHDASRLELLGSDPHATILAHYASHASRLTSHAATPSAPPPSPMPVGSACDFDALIQQFHAGGHTVRIPDVTAFTPRLQRLCRAIEFLMLRPVDAVIFWNGAVASVPVHQDDHDILSVQIVGTKHWTVSTDPPALTNPWKRSAEAPPPLLRSRQITLAPGDLLYLPRGTPHTVQSDSESIHLSIGFTPLTTRDAIQAALDHLSDREHALRLGASTRADMRPAGDNLAGTLGPALHGLADHCRNGGFLDEAIVHWTARMIGGLPKLTGRAVPTDLSASTLVRHSPLAIAELVVTSEIVDFVQPGQHIHVNRAVEAALRFIAETSQFRVGALPGDFGDDIRVALAARFITSGFLEPADGGGTPSIARTG